MKIPNQALIQMNPQVPNLRPPPLSPLIMRLNWKQSEFTYFLCDCHFNFQTYSYSENSNASKSSDSFQSCHTDERRVKVKEAAPGYVMKNEGSKKGKQHSVGRVRETCSREQVRTSGGCKTKINRGQQNNEPWDTTTPSSQEDE